MISAKDKFNWIIDADQEDDVALDYFETEFDIRQFEWDVAIWWNKTLGAASWLGQSEAVEPATALWDWATKILQDKSNMPAIDLADALVKNIASRLPRSEKRCTDHLEVAVA